MESNLVISIVSGLFGLLGIVVATVVGYRQTKITAKSADQQTNISGVNSAIDGLDRLAKQHTAELERVNADHAAFAADCADYKLSSSSQIAKQAGQIEVLQKIPLVNISATLKQIASANKSLALSNTKILERLEKSALSREHEVQDTAEAVEQVKIDLKADDSNKVRKVKDQTKGV